MRSHFHPLAMIIYRCTYIKWKEWREKNTANQLLNIKQNKCAWFLANSKFVGAHYLSEILEIINKSNKTVEC